MTPPTGTDAGASDAAGTPAPAARPPRTPPGPLRTLATSLLVWAVDATLVVLALGGLAPLFANGPALALLGTWLIAYPGLALLRPVRGSDIVAARPDPALMLVLFAIPFVTPPLSALGQRFGVWPLPGGAALRWTGAIVAAAGFALRVAAMRQLGARFSPLVAIQREHALETRGLYAAIRHPGYLGAWLCNLGIVLAFGSAATLPLALAMGVALWIRTGHEEALLGERFGNAWHEYRKRSGRFLPGL